MKLLFDLSDADRAAYLSVAAPDERILYCLPFDCCGDRRVDGRMVFTSTHLYKIRDGIVEYRHPFDRMSDFSVEILYGCCAFYGKLDGVTLRLCRFISGRNLTRYSVMVEACNALSRGESDKLLSSNEPERYCQKCGRPFIKHTQICPYCQSTKDNYKKLWAMTRGLRLLMAVPLIAALLSITIAFIVPILQRILINDYILNTEERQENFFLHFFVIVAGIIFFDVLNRVITTVRERIAVIVGNRFTHRLRTRLFQKIQSLSMNSIQQKSTGDLMGRINNDVNVVQNFVTNLLPTYSSHLLTFVLGLILILAMSPFMSLLIFLPIPFVVFAIFKFRHVMRRAHIRAWIKERHTNRTLQDILSGIRVVKSYGKEDEAIRTFRECTTAQAHQNEKNAKLLDTVFPILGFFLHLGSYLIMWYGNIRLFGGRMSVGELNQFNTYASIIYSPLMQITMIPRNISHFTASFTKIVEILEEQPEITDATDPVELRFNGDVSIRNVTFGYEAAHPVLRDVSVEVKAGEMIGIVGHSGSGKSTLINLIMRMYDPAEGSICIDDVDIRDISQQSLRSQFGVVLQETHLFGGTVRDNIRYALPTATDEQIIRAARAANAHDFIMRLPEGYNTVVGERGHTLSGGERQRIAIARALIHNPPILILDEATASLDTETEKQIQDAIDTLTGNRTTFAIAHRLSTLRNADKILVIDHGMIAEFGTHRELLDRRGIYYKLVMAQTRAALEK